MRHTLLCCILIAFFLFGCTALTPASTSPETAAPTIIPTLPKTATVPAPTARPSPTLVASNEETEEDLPQLISASVSPNTAWSAAVLMLDGTYYLEVASSRIPFTQWLVVEQKMGDIPAYPLPLGWSDDAGLLYYTYQPTEWDGCFGSWSTRGSEVWQLDLANGETSQVTESLGHWLALSPDGKQVAFLDTGAPDGDTAVDIVGVYDLANGMTTSAEIDFLAGKETPSLGLDLIWSPDSKSLIFGALTNTCGIFDDEDRYTVIWADAATLQQEILVRESEEKIQPVSWPETNRVILRGDGGRFLWLNLNPVTVENWP